MPSTTPNKGGKEKAQATTPETTAAPQAKKKPRSGLVDPSDWNRFMWDVRDGFQGEMWKAGKLGPLEGKLMKLVGSDPRDIRTYDECKVMWNQVAIDLRKFYFSDEYKGKLVDGTGKHLIPMEKFEKLVTGHSCYSKVGNLKTYLPKDFQLEQ